MVAGCLQRSQKRDTDREATRDNHPPDRGTLDANPDENSGSRHRDAEPDRDARCDADALPPGLFPQFCKLRQP